MTSAQYYREEARRCRERATLDPASPATARWRQLAAEYDELADSMDGHAEQQPRARDELQAMPWHHRSPKAK
jgi:hypothetical protein